MLASKRDMKHLLLTTIAALLLVGCGKSQQSAPSPETKPAESVAEAFQQETPKAKAPVISILNSVLSGNIQAIKQHLDAGTDVNAKGWGEWTPLHVAAVEGQKETAELLIANGADVSAKNRYGKTLLDFAEGETADLLRKHGGKTGEELNATGN
jgi:predicted component of type VI protein secretion system